MKKLKIPAPSLFSQIIMAFFVAIFSSFLLLFIFYDSSNKRIQNQIISRSTFLAQQSIFALMRGEGKFLGQLIFGYGFVISTMPKNAKIIFESGDSAGELKVFSFGDGYGFVINYRENEIIAVADFSADFNALRVRILLFFVAILVFFSGFFALLIFRLRPLRELQNGLLSFCNGDFSIRLNPPQTPELRVLAENFNAMADKISEQVLVSQMVLRHIAHELKTPIAQAMLAFEAKNNETIKAAILRLNEIISRVLIFEQIKSGSFALNLLEFRAESLVLEALHTSSADENSTELEISADFSIFGDFDFLCVALKNLIDNALKYRTQGKVRLLVRENEILVQNFAPKLEDKISNLFAEFYRGEQSLKNPQISGLGLGLAIVKAVCKLHKIQIFYDFKENIHSFGLKFLPLKTAKTLNFKADSMQDSINLKANL